MRNLLTQAATSSHVCTHDPFASRHHLALSLQGMFNNANVIFRTRFVDGVSTVIRTLGNGPSLNKAAAKAAAQRNAYVNSTQQSVLSTMSTESICLLVSDLDTYMILSLYYDSSQQEEGGKRKKGKVGPAYLSTNPASPMNVPVGDEN